MMLKVHLYVFVWNNFGWVGIYLHLDFCFNVPKASKLIKMPSKGVSGVVKGLVACTNEASSFDHVVPLVESRGGEVLVNGMYFKFLEGINRSDSVLPNIAYDIIEISSFEHVDWIWRHPKLHIDVSYWFVLPISLVLLQDISNRIVFIFGGKTSVFRCFLCSPFAEGSCLQVVDFSWPVPRHIDFSKKSSKLIFLTVFPPEKRQIRMNWSKPPLSFISPKLWTLIASLKDELKILPVRN